MRTLFFLANYVGTVARELSWHKILFSNINQSQLFFFFIESKFILIRIRIHKHEKTDFLGISASNNPNVLSICMK